MTRLLALVVGIAAIVRLGLIGLPGVHAITDMPVVVPPAAHMIVGQQPLPPDHPKLLPPPPDSRLDDDQGEDGAGDMDIEGDEVTTALAKYGIDSEGNLYEVHAPHTEVPRLGTPRG